MILHPPTFNAAFKVAGTTSFRLASSQFLKTNRRGYGGNLQNIPDHQRRVFIPQPGNVFVQNDYEGAEAVAVALLVPEGRFRELVRLGIKIHNYIGLRLFPDRFAHLGLSADMQPAELKAHINYKEFVKLIKRMHREYGLAKRTVHGCLTADHEVLTPQGWRPIAEAVADPNVELYVFDPTTRTGRFEAPTHSHAYHDYTGILHTLTNAYGTMDCTITENHRVLYETNGNLKVTTPANIPRGANIPSAEASPCITELSTQDVLRGRLIAAIHADGYIDAAENVVFHFKKQRKIERLLDLCEAYGLPAWKVRPNADGTTTITLDKLMSAELVTYGKQLTWNWLSYSKAIIYGYVDEAKHWDGHIGPTSQCMLTVHKRHAEILHTLCRMVGVGSALLTIQRDASRQTLYRVGFNGRCKISYNSCTHTEKACETLTSVYCFTVSTGFFFVRRRNAIHITGNSNYSMGWKTFQDTVLKETRGRVVLTAAEAKRLLAVYFETFPEIRYFQVGIEALVREGKEFRNLFGHPITILSRFTMALARTGISWIPQSTVGQCSNIAAARLYDELNSKNLNWPIRNIVHDSILGECPEDRGRDFADMMARNMHFEFTSPVDGWRYAIKVEKQIGRNWGKYDENENPNGMVVITE